MQPGHHHFGGDLVALPDRHPARCRAGSGGGVHLRVTPSRAPSPERD
eukprot:gene25043-biopygen11963